MSNKKKGFKSLKQAFWLYKNKPDTFRQISGKYGVPPGWHEYRDKAESGWFKRLKREEE